MKPGDPVFDEMMDLILKSGGQVGFLLGQWRALIELYDSEEWSAEQLEIFIETMRPIIKDRESLDYYAGPPIIRRNTAE